MRVGFVDDEPQIYPLQYGGKARTILALARSALEFDEIDSVTVMSRSIDSPYDEFTEEGIHFEKLDDHNMMGRIAEEAESADVLSVHTCSFTFPRISEERRKAALIYHLHDVMQTTADKGSHLDKALASDWDAIVSPSDFATQTFRNFAELTGNDTNIHTIPRGIDPELFHKVPKNVAIEELKNIGLEVDDSRYPILFFPGRVGVGKGDDRIAQICESLEEKHPNLMVITTSDIGSQKQHPSVEHVGWQESSKLKYFYSVADVTLALSKLPESFSQVCIESVACDAPVLTFPFGNLPGLSEILPAVRLCDPTNEGVIKEVKDLLTDKGARDALDQSQSTISENYSIKSVSKTYLQLYMDVARHRKEQLKVPAMYFLSPFASVHNGRAYLSNNENAPLEAYDLTEAEQRVLNCCDKASSVEELALSTGIPKSTILSTLNIFNSRKIIMGRT